MDPFGKIKLFRSKCISFFNERLECLVLTGSYARGDFTTSSDIDLWVFIKDICLEDIRKVGEIVVEIGKPPEINPQCTSFAEFALLALKDQFNPIQLYVDSKVLHGSLPALAPSAEEIRNYAGSVAAFALMSARHYISVQESEENLSKGKTMKWVIQPLMWALRYKVYGTSSKYPGSIEELAEALTDNNEKELVVIYSQLLSGSYNGPYMGIVEKAERVSIKFIFNMEKL